VFVAIIMLVVMHMFMDLCLENKVSHLAEIYTSKASEVVKDLGK